MATKTLKKLYKIFLLSFLIFSIFSCESWMQSDDFFEEIDQEVFVANAEKINVYVRYAVTTQGTTTPNGSATFKVDVTGDISCVTNTSYGFHHWAAFSSDFFNIQEQNKDIIYESGPGGYEETILEHELGEEDISFGDKYSQSTTIKIHSNRNDIVLVPIVAMRPTIDRLSPTLNQSGVVRNTSLRYLFTKRMDLQTFNTENIKITSGYSVMTDQEIVSDDITHKFIWGDDVTNTQSPVRSTNGKMITFRLRPGDTVGSNQQITINLSNGIKDIDGYEMESDQRLYFTTGTSVDSLAPIIQELKCGVDDKFLTFDSVPFNGDELTENNAIKTLDDAVFDAHIDHRVKNNINIYLYATDIGGEGVNASTANVDEDAVSFYGIRAKVLYDSNGALSDKSIDAAQYAYIPNGNEIPAKTSDDMKNRGYAFTYDLSSLPDGLIAIDVWAMDTVGNIGLDEPYYETYDNGYRSLLVVKDTSAPAGTTEKEKIISKSEQAIYGWYNNETLGSSYVMVGDNKTITDLGHARLRSSDNKLKWIFAVGEDPSKWTPSATEPGWQNITDGAYALSGINVQKEGPVGILMSLMDDIGNISETVILENTVLSDFTKPEVSASTWVYSNNSAARPVTNKVNLSQFLSVPFTETLSGVRELVVDIDSANGIQSSTSFYYNAINSESLIPYTLSTRNSKQCAVLTPPTDTAGFSSGTIYIGGLALAEGAADGAKTVSVSIFDAALNNSNTVSSTMIYDKTAPVVSNVTVNGMITDEGKNWLSSNSFTGKTPNNASITVNAVEDTSGIEVIKLTGAKLTSNSKLYLGSAVSGSPIACKVDTANGTITLDYSATPALKGSPITFTISCIEFANHIDDGSPNSIGIQLTDFASNTGSIRNSDSVYVDSKVPATPTIKVSDSAQGTISSQWGYDTTKESYTDSDRVDISVTLTGDANGSRIKTLTFTNVTFDGSTISNNGTASGSTITFNPTLDGSPTITITNAKLSESNKTVTVSVTATDVVGWTSSAGSDSIMHDNLSPSFGDGVKWVSVSGGIDGITDNLDQTTATQKQKLKIPYSDSGSGVKVVEITGASINNIEITNDSTALTKDTDFKLSGNYIIFKSPLKSGTLYIDKLQLTSSVTGDTECDVTVSIYDTAENKDDGTKNMATLCVDTTSPELQKIELPEIDSKKQIDNIGTTYFFKRNVLDDNLTVRLTIKEKTAGIWKINFTGDIKPTASSQVKFDTNTYSASNDDFKVSGNTITFDYTKHFNGTKINNPNGDNTFTLDITNCKISNIKTDSSTTGENGIAISVTDFAAQNSSSVNSVSTSSGNATEILAIKLAPSVTSFYAAATSTTTDPTDANDTGSQFGRTYVNDDNTTFFNDNARLGITYSTETNWFDAYAANPATSAEPTEPTTYSVKAQLYFKQNGSDNKKYSDWYTFKLINKENTFYMPYPNLGEGAFGQYYLILEDSVGNRSETQVWNGSDSTSTATTFCYNNASPVVTSTATGYDGNEPKNVPITNLVTSTNRVNETTSTPSVTTVHSGTFNIKVSQTATSGFKYKYYTSDSVAIGETEAAGFSTGNGYTTIPVDDVIPEQGSSSSAIQLWLYTIDNVGNLSKTQIGNTTWFKDQNAPTGTKDWTDGAGHTNNGNSYISRSTDTKGDMTVAIAAADSNQTYVDAKSDGTSYRVYIPVSWFKDDCSTGSEDNNLGVGVYGLSLSADISKVNTSIFNDDTTNHLDCFAIDIPYEIFSDETKKYLTTPTNYYVYDKVGNYVTYRFYVNADDTAPEVGVKFSGIHSLYSTDLYKSFDGTETAENPFTSIAGYSFTENKTAYTEKTSEKQDESTPKILWAYDNTITLELESYDDSGISSISIDKFNESSNKYEAISGSPFTNNNANYENWIFGDNTGKAKTKYNSSITLTSTEGAGTKYKITASDFNGNSMSHYVCLVWDNTSPNITTSNVNVNSGARIKDNTLYYNSMTVDFALTDTVSGVAGIGLGAYKFSSSTTYSEVNSETLQETFNAAEYSNSPIELKVQDKLGNQSTHNLTYNTATNFTYDNKAPEWDTTTPLTVSHDKGERFITNYDTTNKIIFIKSDEDATVTITPNAEDVGSSSIKSDIKGYIVNTTGETPTSDSMTDYPTTFTISCGKTKTTSQSNFTLNLKLSTATSDRLHIYIYPVDYAGNVGKDALEVTFAYMDCKPNASNLSVSEADGYIIHKVDNKNYFNGKDTVLTSGSSSGEYDTGVEFTATITLPDDTNFPLTSFKLVDGSNTTLATQTYATGKTNTNLTGYKFRIPYSFTTGDNVSVVFCNEVGESAPIPFTYNSCTNWEKDITPPSDLAVAKQVKSDGTDLSDTDLPNGFHLNGNTLYYKNNSTSTYLNFTAADTQSQFKGVANSSTLNKSTSSQINDPTKVQVTMPDGTDTTQTFYAYDNILNCNTTGLEIAYKKDASNPNITDIAIKGYKSGATEGGYYLDDTVADDWKFYYNATTDHEKQVNSITLTVDANDYKTPTDSTTVLSGIKSYSCTAPSGVTVTQDSTDKTKFTLTSLASGTVTITVTDNVGNSSTKTITLIPDSDAPTGTFTVPDNEYKGFYINTTTNNFYFTTSKISGTDIFSAPAVFTAKTKDNTDGSGLKGYYYKIDTTSVDISGTADTDTTISIGLSDIQTHGEKTIAFYAVDKVGNEKELAKYTLKDASTPPAKPSISKLQNASDSSETSVSYTHGETDWKTAGGKKVYFNKTIYSSGVNVLFTSGTDNGGSGIAGVYGRTGTTLTDYVSEAIITAEKTLTVYTKDNVGNESDNFTITVVPDAEGPSKPDGTAGVTLANGGDTKVHLSSSKYYYNASDDKKIESLSFALSKTADVIDFTDGATGSGIKGYVYTITADGSDSLINKDDITPITTDTFTIPVSELTTSIQQIVKVYAKDNVGNYSAAPVSFTLVPDAAAPAITGTEAAKLTTSDNVHFVSASSTCYYNSNEKDASDSTKIKPISFAIDSTKLTGESVSGISGVVYILSTSTTAPTATTATATLITGNTLSINPSGTIQYIHFFGVDNVGNYSATPVTFTLIPDAVGPTLKDGTDGVTLSNGGNTKVHKKTVGSTVTYHYNASSTNKISYLSFTLTADDFTDGTNGCGINESGYVYTITTDGTESTETTISLSSGVFTISVDDLNTSKTQIINAYAKDNLGNYSATPVSFTLVPDGAAPTVTGATSGVYNAATTPDAGWYLLYEKDSGENMKPSMAIYDRTTATIAATDDTGIKYAFIYFDDSTAPAAPTETTAWADYPATGDIPLPEITSDNGSYKYLYLYLKDSVGNSGSTQIVYKNGGTAYPIEMYEKPTGLNYNVFKTEWGVGFIFTGYPLTAGFKSIKIAEYTGGYANSYSLYEENFDNDSTDSTIKSPKELSIVKDGFIQINTGATNPDISYTITITDAVGNTATLTNVDNTSITPAYPVIYKYKDADNNIQQTTLALTSETLTLTENTYYAITYGSEAWTSKPATWTEVTSTSVDLPAFTSITDGSYCWLWIKNSADGLIDSVRKITYSNSGTQVPVAKYTAPSVTYTYASNKLTISDYPISAGLKSITITFADTVDLTDKTFSIPATDLSYSWTSSVDNTNHKATLSLDSAYIISGDIEITFPDSLISAASEITAVSVIDAYIDSVSGTPTSISPYTASRSAIISRFITISEKPSGISSAVSNITSNIVAAIGNIFVPDTDEVQYKENTITEKQTSSDIKKSPEKKSQKKIDKKTQKKSTNETLKQPQAETLRHTDISTQDDRSAQEDTLRLDNSHSELVSESHITKPHAESPIIENQKIPLEENTLIEYNYIAIGAIIAAVVASITLAVILLLKKKRINRIGGNS